MTDFLWEKFLFFYQHNTITFALFATVFILIGIIFLLLRANSRLMKKYLDEVEKGFEKGDKEDSNAAIH